MLTFKADLHTHSHYSDGSSLVSELIELAKAADLQGLSITDHDTLLAYREALPLAKEQGLALLSGIELSAYFESTSVHILGYGFDLNNPALLYQCEQLAQAREERNRLILEKLKRYRFIITEEELKEAFPNRTLGRPHIAKLMVKKGYVSNIKDAFTNYLGDKGRCNKNVLEVLSVSEAIDLIHQANGVAVLAHPHLFKNKKFLAKLLNQTSTFDGLETYYGLMPPHLEQPIIDLATQYNLFMTGGSDFHGAMTPHLRLGCSFTNEELFNKLYQLHIQNN